MILKGYASYGGKMAISAIGIVELNILAICFNIA